MTSKRLFADLCIENKKRRLWPLALSIIANFFAQLVYAYLAVIRYEERLATARTTIEDIRIAYLEMAGGFTPQVALILFGLAFLIAIQGYGYLFDSKMADLYGALPVKREKIFASVCLNGILIFAVPYIVFDICTIIFGFSKGYLLVSFIPQIFGMLFVNMVMYSLVFLVCTLACVMTGHIVVSAMAMFVFFVAGPAITFIFDALKNVFFISYFEETQHEIAQFTSPLWAYIDIMADTNKDKYTVIGSEVLIKTLILAVICIVLYILCRFLIKIRPSEAAGSAIAFEKTKPFIKCIISIVVALYSGMFFREIGGKFGVLIFGIICGAVMSHLVIETIFEFDFKACLSHFGTLIFSLVASLFILLAFVFDLFGYESWLPRSDKVKTYAISQNYVYNGLYYSGDKGESIIDDTYVLDNMALTNMEEIEPLLISGAEFSKKYHMYSIFHDDLYDMENEENSGKNYGLFSIKWEMKSGKKIYRTFRVDLNDEKNKECVKKIFENPEYKYGIFQILNMTEDDFDGIRYDDIIGSHELKISKKDRKALLEAVREDIINQSFDEIVNETPSMSIGVTDDESYYGMCLCNFYVYPSFTNSKKVLEEIGIPTDWKEDIDKVYSLGISCYNYENETYVEWDTEDRDEIDAVLESGRFSYISTNSIWSSPEKEAYVDLIINGNNIGALSIYDIDKLPAEVRDIIDTTDSYY